MGNCGAREPMSAEEAAQRSKEVNVNKKIEEEHASYKRKWEAVKKMLLLGAGESGKSTVFKQIKCLHGTGYTTEQLMQFIPVIHKSTIMNMKTLVRYSETDPAIYRLGSATIPSKNFIMEYIESDPFTYEVARHIKTLWSDSGIQKVWEDRAKFQVEDCCPYFFNRVNDLARPDYLPSKDDMFRLRIRTTGITEMHFELEEVPFLMVDVGGQRNERKKWIHCFDSVTSVIFVAAINEYDQHLFEDETVNRMDEALRLFDEICNCKWFLNTSMILFLNKSDLLQEKIQKVPLTVFWPDFPGELGDFDVAVDFIREQFVGLNKNPGRREIYTHVTCATDTNNIQHVFNSVKDTVVKGSLRAVGILD